MSADEMSFGTGRLREAEGPAQCGRAASSPDGRTGGRGFILADRGADIPADPRLSRDTSSSPVSAAQPSLRMCANSLCPPIGSVLWRALTPEVNTDLESGVWQVPGVRAHVWPYTHPMGRGIGSTAHMAGHRHCRGDFLPTSSPTTILRAGDKQVTESASAVDPLPSEHRMYQNRRRLPGHLPPCPSHVTDEHSDIRKAR